jgi:hypothetical protein
MALITKELARLSDAQEPPQYATLWFTYDDVDLRMRSIRVQNDTNHSVYGEAKRSSGTGPTYSRTWQPGADETISIGTGVNQRLQLTVTPSGKLDGVEWIFHLV